MVAQRLTIVQYAGDFAEAARRLAEGGRETYRGQRYTVDYVEELVRRDIAVTTIAGITDTAYDVTLPSGARAIGAGFSDGVDHRALVRLLKSTRPDVVILRFPSRPLMLWCAVNRVRTLLLLADSVDLGSAKSRLVGRINALLMRAPNFEVVANHGVAAARQLVATGVPARKVVAWDYPSFNTPADRPAKPAPNAQPILFYCGLVSAAKGVFDLVDAVGAVRARGHNIRLRIAGRDADGAVAAHAAKQGLEDAVEMLGMVPNDTIIDAMAASDAVVVPSRHDYSEGLPLTIYEAYCSRTPLIASDHPMFATAVEDGVSAVQFTAGSVDALAGAIERLFADPTVYAALSRGGEAAWQRMQIDVKWHALIDQWLAGGPALRGWLAQHALGSRS